MATTEETSPSYRVTAHRSARNELDAIPAETREKLTDRIAEAAEFRQPTQQSDTAALRDADLFRVRAGQYRALCTLAKPELRVLVVAKRPNVYDRISEAESRMG